MTDFRITVRIDPTAAERGSKRVENSLNRVGNAADRVRSLIARAFAFIGLSVGIRQLVRLADTFTNIQNRIRIVTNSTAELNAVTNSLFQVANRTRSSFEATAEVYARTALATRELGLSQAQTIRFTESLNQAVILSGANAQEANAALIQLSQGLASGALRGDELRSVLEQLPVVADVIADSLGVTRGELRELGAEGRITADIVLEAFAEAREELEGRFAKTVPTISQSMQVLRNRFVAFIGALDESNGASRLLSRTILTLSENLELLARVAAAAGFALAVDFARRGVGQAVLAVRALTLAIAANPIGALAVAVTGIISVLVAFNDQIKVSGQRIATVGDFGLAVFEALGEAVDELVEFAVPKIALLSSAFEEAFGDIELSFEGILRFLARDIDRTIGAFRGVGRAIVIIFETVAQIAGSRLELVFNTIINKIKGAVNNLIKGVNVLLEFIGQEPIRELELTADRVVEPSANIGRRIQQAIATSIEEGAGIEAALDRVLNRAEEIARERIARSAAEAEGPGFDLEAGGEPREDGFLAGFNEQLDAMISKTNDVAQQFHTLGTEVANIFGPGGTLTQGLSQGIAQSIVFGRSFTGTLRAIGQQILVSIIGSLIKVGIQMGINALLGRTLGAAAVATTSAQAAGLAAAWGPAATLASVATLGAAAVTGTAALGTAIAAGSTIAATAGTTAAALGGATAPGFANGGFVDGPGTSRSDDIVARLSRGEFVVNAQATKQFRPLLEDINAGRTPSAGSRSVGDIIFAPVNTFSGSDIDAEELSERQQQQFEEFLDREFRSGGRLEGVQQT
jgi:tape measure domain-containing protein